MRKSFLFAVAGAGFILAGCNATNHRYQMIPVDDPAASKYPAAQQQQPRKKVVQPEMEIKELPDDPITPAAPVKKVKYAPMTDAKSSGGVDSVNAKKGQDLSDKEAAGGNGTTHIVKKGENPSTIAKKYGISTNALLKANGLDMESAKRLKIGQKLVIPGRSAAGKKQQPQQQLEAGDGKHRIQAGETLGVIAKRYRVKLKDLMAANNIDENGARRLQVGQVIVIPGKAGAAVKIDSDKLPKTDIKKEESTNTTDDAMSIETTMYDVKEETTYAALAAKFGVSENTMRALNGNDQSAVISNGTVLLVPKR